MLGSSIYFEKYIVGAPSIITGVKYQFLNKHQKENAAIIISGNYGIVRYLKYRIKYKINGQERNDYLSEKGINFQFGFLVPIARFRNKKSEK
jgi:hypothetical protein